MNHFNPAPSMPGSSPRVATPSHATRSATRIAVAFLMFVAPAQAQRVAGQNGPAVTAAYDPSERSITELQAAMTAGRVTSAQLTSAYLARIAAYDHAGPTLNTMIRLNPSARADATAMDAERKAGRVRGPLHGIPIILKDNFDTQGLATSAGSIALAAHRPAKDAYVVRKLRDAGAIILGKSNLHELASGITTISSLGGQTLNPYNPDRCPGGSSGGTAAAIAANFAAIGWGSDTCGSIRIPAAFGSLFGLRPTQGLYSRTGVVPLSTTQDVPGPLARTVMDLAIGLDLTAGADPEDPQSKLLAGRAAFSFRDSLRTDALRGARIGIFRPYFRDAEGDIADTVRSAINSMRALGAEVVDVPMPDFDQLIANSRAIGFDFKFDLADYLARSPDAPVTSLTEILGKGLYDRQLEFRFVTGDTLRQRESDAYRTVLARQAQLRARMVALLDSLKLDAIAYPTIGQRPVLVGAAQTLSSCALSAQSGLPAISMPAGFTNDGLPTGLELLGRPFSDARLVAFAYAFEQAAPRRRAPSTAPPLVGGAAPKPVAIAVSAGTPLSGIQADVTFTPAPSELSVVARTTGPQAGRVQAVVVRRWDAAPDRKSGARRVILRVLGPGMPRGTTRLRLLGDDLAAFRDGRLSIAVYGDVGSDPLGETVVRAPR